jgi:hypothetical protein
MTQVTVKELAQVVDTPVERLLQQMREAGLPHTSAEQVVTDNEKQALLAHLKSSHGEKLEEPRKITLQRKTTTTLKENLRQTQPRRNRGREAARAGRAARRSGSCSSEG